MFHDLPRIKSVLDLIWLDNVSDLPLASMGFWPLSMNKYYGAHHLCLQILIKDRDGESKRLLTEHRSLEREKKTHTKSPKTVGLISCENGTWCRVGAQRYFHETIFLAA